MTEQSTTQRSEVVAADPNYVSPSGASEIRLLLQRPEGEITHATCPAGRVAKAATVGPLAEMYYVLAGEGLLWRRAPEYDGVTRLGPGRWAFIPPGTHFQYRADGATDLVFLVIVAPQWLPEHHSLVEDGRWDDTAPTNDDDLEARAQPWQEGALPAPADYFAPDGSEIRLLTELGVASVAHCSLPPGQITAPVRHRSVNEIWFVLGGHGELWRQPPDRAGWTTPLRYGVCVDIEVGETFQFRSTGLDPLTLLLLTAPSWPGPDEAEAVSGKARW